MKARSATSILVTAVVASMALLADAHAKWRDQSGNLDFGGEAGIAIVGIGVGAWILVRHHNKNRSTLQLSATDTDANKSVRFTLEPLSAAAPGSDLSSKDTAADLLRRSETSVFRFGVKFRASR